jgi:peptide deformylase
MKIVTDKNFLRTKCSLSDNPEATLKILKDNFNKKKYIGLSAIQLGINDRVAVIWDSKKKRWIDIIDWIIIEKRFPFDFADETCLSLPGKAYLTERFRWIKVKDGNSGAEYEWRYGNDGTPEEQCDLLAIAVQQEIDHMNGIILEDIAVSSRDIPIITETIRVEKIGRNEPCPCGSGKKYKKCCEN